MGGLVLLIDEPIKSGNHVLVLGHSGVVEHMYLQYFTLRQYDKGLAFIPNGVVFDHVIQVHAKSQGTCFDLTIPLARSTSAAATRAFVRDVDSFLASYAQAMAAKPVPPSTTTSRTTPSAKAAAVEPSSGTIAPPPKSQFHLAVQAFARTSLFTKAAVAAASDTHLHAPAKFWVALVDVYTVQLVYFFPPNLKFRHIVDEKRQLVLAVTKLMQSNELTVATDDMAGDADASPVRVNATTLEACRREAPCTTESTEPQHDAQGIRRSHQRHDDVDSPANMPSLRQQRPPSSSIEFSSSTAATAASILRRRSTKPASRTPPKSSDNLDRRASIRPPTTSSRQT
ncbi:hypothetical protein DYB32_009672 [Aphanomyces invadans]|nr:hypothetical protein DYB32_009672 [Aphanomyces invadans]